MAQMLVIYDVKDWLNQHKDGHEEIINNNETMKKGSDSLAAPFRNQPVPLAGMITQSVIVCA